MYVTFMTFHTIFFSLMLIADRAVSPLTLSKESFPKVLTVLDASLVSSTTLFAVHPSSSEATVFLQGKDIAAYLKSLESSDTKIHEIDFAALKNETTAAVASSSLVFSPILHKLSRSDPNPNLYRTAKPAAKVEKEDAKIDGAKQIAVGIKKEVDFAGWYTNV